uniref:M16 family metallopeptidase n=1 Tax=Prevotella sp. TaxID=59823 RepID=UPI00307B1EE8
SSTPKDLETMLQLVYLYFTNINKDQKSMDNLMSQYEVQLKNRELNPDIAFGDSLTATVYNHNPRVAPMTVDRLKDVNYDRILQIAKERTANAKAWTFEIVGNFDEATIRPLICQYLAALPAKGKIVKGKREVIPAKGEISNIFKRKQETPKSTAYMTWHNETMPYTLKNAICADIAGQVLSMEYLDKIREKESAAYSVGAQGAATLGDDNYHIFQLIAYCPMKPEKKDVAIKIMNDEMKTLETSCDPAKFQKCKEFVLKQNGDQVKTNGYWLNVIGDNYFYGFDSHSDYVKTVEALTPQDICNFVKEFNKAGNHVTVMILPE